MGYFKIRNNKDGSASLQLRSSMGYDDNGKHIEASKTVRIPSTISAEMYVEYAQQQLLIFEHSLDSKGTKITFSEYTEKFMEKQKPKLKATTYVDYEDKLAVINDEIGDIPFADLDSHRLEQFYVKLSMPGAKLTSTYVTGRGLRDKLYSLGITQDKLHEMSGVSFCAIRKACNPPKHIALESAIKIAAALGCEIDDIFDVHCSTEGLSSTTIHSYHALISKICREAVRDGVILCNISDRDHLDPPKRTKPDISLLETDEIGKLIAFLTEKKSESSKTLDDWGWLVALEIMIKTGMRRGELIGLEWEDIDFKGRVIKINRACVTVRGLGIVTTNPKTFRSKREIPMTDKMYDLMTEYYEIWLSHKTKCGGKWQDKITITLDDESKKTIENNRLFINPQNTLPRHPDSLNKTINKLIAQNNLPHFTPHTLRHAAATLMLIGGTSINIISALLGHSTPSFTLDVYTYSPKKANQQAIQDLEQTLEDCSNPNVKLADLSNERRKALNEIFRKDNDQ